MLCGDSSANLLPASRKRVRIRVYRTVSVDNVSELVPKGILEQFRFERVILDGNNSRCVVGGDVFTVASDKRAVVGLRLPGASCGGCLLYTSPSPRDS